MKPLFFLALIGLALPVFAQTNEASGAVIDKTVEERINKIVDQVVSEYNLRKEPGYYVPAISVGVRFSGENFFFDRGVFLFGAYLDIRFMRFTHGFALLRMLVETPLSARLPQNPNREVMVLSSAYIVSGGFGGGFSFWDTRLGKNGLGHVATVSFLATIGSRFGTPGSPMDALNTFGGLEVGFRYQYYFFRYSAFQVGLDIGLRFGTTSTVTYGGAIGVAF